MSNQLNVFVTDADDRGIVGALVSVLVNGKTVSTATTTTIDQPISLTLPPDVEAIQLRAQVGDQTREATVAVSTRNYSFKFENVHTKKDGEEKAHVPKAIWIPALAFAAILLLFFMFVFFKVPTMTRDQKDVLSLLFPLLCGFSAFFMGGTALFGFNFPKGNGWKVTFSATAGIAVFAFTYVKAPYWFRANEHTANQPESTNAVHLRAEGKERLRRLRQSYTLCKLSSVFLVDDKIALVDSFITNHLKSLDICVNPKYQAYAFRAIITDPINESDKETQEWITEATATLEQLPEAGRALRSDLVKYGQTRNDHGGAEALQRSTLDLQRLVDLLNKLRTPWTNEIAAFPYRCD